MKNSEKEMRRYLSAVKRKLNLPRKIKQRVMSDFISSIQARREAGMSDQEIMEELGTPGKAAKDLNEQMQEFAYRKSPWRYLFAAIAVYGAWQLAEYIGIWLLYLSMADPFLRNSDAASIGIIGGADGPTAIFVTTPQWVSVLIPVLMLIVGIFGFWYFCRRRKK